MNYRTARLVLGTNSASTYTEIKQAFRKKALELHPDRNPSPNAASRFSTLVESYRCLMDYRSYAQRMRYRSKANRGPRVALVKL